MHNAEIILWHVLIADFSLRHNTFRRGEVVPANTANSWV
jgi:hypothetical protein